MRVKPGQRELFLIKEEKSTNVEDLGPAALFACLLARLILRYFGTESWFERTNERTRKNEPAQQRLHCHAVGSAGIGERWSLGWVVESGWQVG